MNDQVDLSQLKNFDGAFPPFIPGAKVSSVYERAGFEVNKQVYESYNGRSQSRSPAMRSSHFSSTANLSKHSSTYAKSVTSEHSIRSPRMVYGNGSQFNGSNGNLTIPHLQKRPIISPSPSYTSSFSSVSASGPKPYPSQNQNSASASQLYQPPSHPFIQPNSSVGSIPRSIGGESKNALPNGQPKGGLSTAKRVQHENPSPSPSPSPPPIPPTSLRRPSLSISQMKLDYIPHAGIDVDPVASPPHSKTHFNINPIENAYVTEKNEAQTNAYHNIPDYDQHGTSNHAHNFSFEHSHSQSLNNFAYSEPSSLGPLQPPRPISSCSSVYSASNDPTQNETPEVEYPERFPTVKLQDPPKGHGSKTFISPSDSGSVMTSSTDPSAPSAHRSTGSESPSIQTRSTNSSYSHLSFSDRSHNSTTPTSPEDSQLIYPPLDIANKFPSEVGQSLKKINKICRGCDQRIIGKSVSSKDQQLSGRWHKECFTCHRCHSATFTSRVNPSLHHNSADSTEFYVLNDLPYCHDCYHLENNSICQSCGSSIEGECIETTSADFNHSNKDANITRYHVDCLVCLQCRQPITEQEYYSVQNIILCSLHAQTFEFGDSTTPTVEKRRTRLLMM